MKSLRSAVELIRFSSLTVGEQAFLRRAGMRPKPTTKVAVGYVNHPDELWGAGSPNGVVHQQACSGGVVQVFASIRHDEGAPLLPPGSYALHVRDVEHREYVTNCTCGNRKHIWRPGKRGEIEFPSATAFLRSTQIGDQALTLQEALKHGWMEMYFPEFGAHGTRRCGRSSKGSWLLWRFVPRPLTLLKALEYGEVSDLGWARVEADKLFEMGRAAEGEQLAKYLYQEAAP